jgi:cyclophilin family peptidyl-prolyl cis-trans isomerase
MKMEGRLMAGHNPHPKREMEQLIQNHKNIQLGMAIAQSHLGNKSQMHIVTPQCCLLDNTNQYHNISQKRVWYTHCLQGKGAVLKNLLGSNFHLYTAIQLSCSVDNMNQKCSFGLRMD